MALIADSLTKSGMLKSGSPRLTPMISTPCSVSSRVLAAMANVAEVVISFILLESLLSIACTRCKVAKKLRKGAKLNNFNVKIYLLAEYLEDVLFLLFIYHYNGSASKIFPPTFRGTKDAIRQIARTVSRLEFENKCGIPQRY